MLEGPLLRKCRSSPGTANHTLGRFFPMRAQMQRLFIEEANSPIYDNRTISTIVAAPKKWVTSELSEDLFADMTHPA